ncbi:GNAT family N-acetyltransferase [Pseudoalteromonas sp. SMS1]|uniref:GNAT family N-acetyltransferase n=1 Tax=Pseudoalteromonas sp. SMS1 TaxID=2908894 RepID=UPI001F2B3D8C|nr:GNAT family N-acetyltransferase [Pseudoalteromonas sp. SMS1]MCF2856391.1 GNAT family N-acetyltransferase [Pseudoalteromonas sp. SMS1]
MLNKPVLGHIAELKTPRLRLRQWCDSDKEIFASMSSDPEVMRYFPALLSARESDVLVDKFAGLIAENGYGFWALTVRNEGLPEVFIGFVGLHWQTQVDPNRPFMEIGWRLARRYWGVGYAREAAQAVLTFAFETLNLQEVYAFTALSNLPSQKLMNRLGMKNVGQDFLHPNLPSGHPLQAHCLYKITAQHLM